MEGFLIPVFAARLHDQRPLVAAVAITMVGGLGGLLLAPSAGWVWVLVLGTSNVLLEGSRGALRDR